MKNNIIRLLNSQPYIRGLYKQNQDLRKRFFVEPGHFHSPFVSAESIEAKHWEDNTNGRIMDIELNTEEQLTLLGILASYYDQIPFSPNKKDGFRYFFDNEYYSYSDGITLYSIIRSIKPSKIIEVGSGYSSAVMMDTNDNFFNGEINLTFVEPFPLRLFSLMNERDHQKYKVYQDLVQGVPKIIFEELEKGDILFIDSSHIVKTGSDVNFILFEILPLLKSGVFIHFHDIFYPFEYPKEWVLAGRNWNETYALRAFLMYNSNFKIKLFSDYLHKYHSSSFEGMPMAYINWGGSLWLEKN